MEMREKLIKVAAEALYKDVFCLEQKSENGCAACRSDADRRATIAVDAVLSAVEDERSAAVRYLREEADKSGTTPMAEVLGDAADTIERGLHRDA